MKIDRRSLIAGAVAAPLAASENVALTRADPAYARKLEVLAKDVISDTQRVEAGLSLADMEPTSFIRSRGVKADFWVRREILPDAPSMLDIVRNEDGTFSWSVHHG